METQLEHELMLMGDRQKGVLFGGTHPDIFHPDDVLCAVILRTELPQYGSIAICTVDRKSVV